MANIWQTHVHQNAPSQGQLRRAKAPGRRHRLSSRLRLRLVLGALRVYLGDAPLCVSTPSGHCLLAALAAFLRPACVLCVNKSNGQMGEWMCCLLFCLPFAASPDSNCANWPQQMSLSSQEQRANCRLKLPKRRRRGELSELS